MSIRFSALLWLVGLFMVTPPVAAQHRGDSVATVRVRVLHAGVPVAGAIGRS